MTQCCSVRRSVLVARNRADDIDAAFASHEEFPIDEGGFKVRRHWPQYPTELLVV
jgi:hypothetical protein